jgi:hypothetical protein
MEANIYEKYMFPIMDGGKFFYCNTQKQNG